MDGRLKRALSVEGVFGRISLPSLNIFTTIGQDSLRGVYWYIVLLLCSTKSTCQAKHARLSPMSTARGKCSRCGRCFRRLDTHLRVSATCRDVRRPERQAAPPSSSMNTVFFTTNSNSVASNLNSSTTLPGNSTQEASAVAATNFTATLGIQDNVSKSSFQAVS